MVANSIKVFARIKKEHKHKEKTGSGKTYTMTGSTKKYQDRGIIPRSLQFVFSSIEKTDEKPMLYISYMEIYNETCYDLINPKTSKTALRLEDLARVAILEDKRGEPHLTNLSVLPVSTEEEALRLLFLGDTNRVIAETPLNEYSSRSHCIFTIYITSRPNGSQAMRFSKLNLVDLAGSERVYKSNITGTVLNEAKHINLSLHFLQQVILALSEPKRSHIPYRNSLMTFILKDSLAGNCLTVMLATLAVTKQNILETISTCKFAQRVSLIKTEPIINEVSDPYKEILLLKNEIQELKKQLAHTETSVLKLEGQPLTSLQKEECDKKLEEYLNHSEGCFNIISDPKLSQYCFMRLKNKILKLENQKLEYIESNKTADLPKYEITSDKTLLTPKQDHSLYQEFMSNSKNCEEIDYYNEILSSTYQKAKTIALTVEECQRNIRYIREKLDVIRNAECSKRKFELAKELEHQQHIYRKGLVELKELKQETMQLEAGLKKAKTRMLQRFSKWTNNKINCKKNLEEHENQRFNFGDNTSMCEGYSACQCYSESNDQSDFFTPKNYYPQPNDLNLDCDMAKYAWKHRCDFKEHFMSESDNDCCISSKRSTDNKLNRKKSVTTFFPDIKTDLKNAGYKCVCNNNCLQIKSDVNKAVCNIDTSDKNENTRCTYHACAKRYYENCNCAIRYNDEGSYSNSIMPVPKYLDPNQVIYTYPNLTTQPDNPCCCVNREISESSKFVCKSSRYYQGPSEQLKFHQYPARDKDTSTFIRDINNYKDYNLNSISSVYKTTGDFREDTSCISSVTDSDSVDTQLIPSKLSIGNSSEKSMHNVSSPNCQDILTTSCNNNFNDKNVKIIEVGKKGINDSNIKENKSISEIKAPKKFDIYLESDTNEFRKFMENISLTGDEEIDKEICNFYRMKVSV